MDWWLCCCFVAKSLLTLLQSLGLSPTRLLCSWDFLGKNTGVGCHALLQGIFLTQESNSHLLQVVYLPLSHQENPGTDGKGWDNDRCGVTSWDRRINTCIQTETRAGEATDDTICRQEGNGRTGQLSSVGILINALNKVPYTEWLKQQKFLLIALWLEVQDQGVGRLMLLLAVLGKVLFQVSSWCLAVPSLLVGQFQSSPGILPVGMPVSSHAFFFEGYCYIRDPPCSSMTSYLVNYISNNYFQISSPSEVLGFRAST